jgi:hypothetical protein
LVLTLAYMQLLKKSWNTKDGNRNTLWRKFQINSLLPWVQPKSQIPKTYERF